jgi:methionyl-tRNA synthetase
VDLVLINIWEKLAALDKHINENTPWKIDSQVELKKILSYEVNTIRKIALYIEPFMPTTARRIQQQFGDMKISSAEGLFPRM